MRSRHEEEDDGGCARWVEVAGGEEARLETAARVAS